jgi:diguanylate cyclase (GGDEF)-like protein
LREKSPRYFDLHITPLRDQHKRFLGRLVIFQDTTQRKLTEIELARNFEQLGIINRINQAITSGLDLDHVLKTLHEQCALVAPIDIFYVALYDETTSLIQIPLYYERGLYQAGSARDISESPGNIGKVIQTCRTLYLHDIEMPHTGPLPSLLPSGAVQARSYVGIPLILRDKAIGAMAIQSYKPNAYTDDQIGLLETIAVQAAIAIGNARLYAEVQRLAIIDELTDLYNYRGLIALGAREVERARRFTRPLSALFFDIDRFKELNDHYSHATGNLVLQAIAQCCQSTMRSVDLVARYGGDEFVVLLPETDPATAQEVANRLNREIAALHIPTEHGELGVTVSIGVTELDEDIKDIFALVDRANQGEHQAKETGGNRSVAIAG